MIICAELGNSGIRLAALDNGPTENSDPRWRRNIGSAEDAGSFRSLLPAESCHWLLASVHQSRLESLCHWLREYRPQDSIRRLTSRDIPIRCETTEPDRTGIDRLLAAWRACRLPGVEPPLIVVDAGTAVTVDFVDQHSAFIGGNIFPGTEACFRQLAGSTDQLPLLLTADVPDQPLGKSTHEAIASGVWRSQAGAVRFLVEQLMDFAALDRMPVIITGGGMRGLLPLLPVEWRYEPRLLEQAMINLAATIE